MHCSWRILSRNRCEIQWCTLTGQNPGQIQSFRLMSIASLFSILPIPCSIPFFSHTYAFPVSVSFAFHFCCFRCSRNIFQMRSSTIPIYMRQVRSFEGHPQTLSLARIFHSSTPSISILDISSRTHIQQTKVYNTNAFSGAHITHAFC